MVENVAKIYVSIASYRDPLVQSTIDNLFITSSGSHVINVGVFVQEFSTDPISITNTYGGKVNYESKLPGCVFSVSKCRSLANKWLDESYDYVLQIDAHSRFENNWDDILVKEHKKTEQRTDSNVLFSTYLPGWTPFLKELLFSYDASVISNVNYNNKVAKKSLFDTYELVPYLEVQMRDNYLSTKNWYTCGHFIFGPAKYFLDVVQPSWILFWGEELYHSLMAFTNGWDVYVPYNLPVRHMYPQDVKNDMVLNKLWDDFQLEWELNKMPSTDLVIDNILNKLTGKEHFGTTRSVDELYSYLGYDIGKLLDSWREEYRLEYNRQIH